MATHDPERFKSMRTAGMYATIPAILLAAPVVGYFIGDRLASWLGTGDWLKAVMIVLGLAAGALEVAKIIKRAGE